MKSSIFAQENSKNCVSIEESFSELQTRWDILLAVIVWSVVISQEKHSSSVVDWGIFQRATNKVRHTAGSDCVECCDKPGKA